MVLALHPTSLCGHHSQLHMGSSTGISSHKKILNCAPKQHWMKIIYTYFLCQCLLCKLPKNVIKYFYIWMGREAHRSCWGGSQKECYSGQDLQSLHGGWPGTPVTTQLHKLFLCARLHPLISFFFLHKLLQERDLAEFKSFQAFCLGKQDVVFHFTDWLYRVYGFNTRPRLCFIS